MAESIEVREYLAAVRAALTGVPGRDCDEAIAELDATIRAEVETRGGDSAAVQATLAGFGSPDEYARALRDALVGEADATEPQGRFLGMPYEFRAPTATSIRERMWNPSDPRIAMPRLFGLGWTVNFGALAVRLGLMRPDDIEARPFGNLSARAVGAAVAVPVATGIAALVITGAFWSRLPAEVPIHFTGAGVADDWAPKAVALGALLAIAAGLPLVILAWHALRRASRAVIAITSVVLGFSSVLTAVILGYTIANAVYGVEGWWIGALIVGSLAVPGVMLYLLARASLKAEWRATAESRGATEGEDVR